MGTDWRINKSGTDGMKTGYRRGIGYRNDIAENINSSIRLSADHTSLYIIVNDPFDAAITLNVDLSRVNAWATQWLFLLIRQIRICYVLKESKPILSPSGIYELPIYHWSCHAYTLRSVSLK